MRLIDADALKEKLNSFLIVGGRGYGKTECQRYLNKILSEIIDDVPTADVELLMRHECWIYDGEDRRCSGCKAIIEKYEWHNHNWNFCYHCGAKMDGGDTP